MIAESQGPRHRLDSLRRIAVYVLVLCLHLGLLALFEGRYFFLAESYQNRAREGDVLHLRFISLPKVPPSHIANYTAEVITPREARHQSKRQPLATHVTDRIVAQVSDNAVIQTAPSAHLPMAPSPVSAGGSDYRAGGNVLQGPTDGRVSVRLPGSDAALVRELHMTDPRMQGIGGAVHIVQALFGVVDSHCVDVGVWRNLSTQELLARHISQERIDRTAADYRCAPD